MKALMKLDTSQSIPTIHFLTELSDTESTEIFTMLDRYDNLCHDTKTYLPVNDAFNELECAVKDRSNGKSVDFEKLSRNYLFSIRTYLDHWETRLKREYKDNEGFLNLFKEVTHREFDENIEYRIAYRLRNYVQHCNSLVHFITTRVNDNEIHLFADINKLLGEFSEWKKEEIEFLEIHKEKIELMVLFRIMKASLNRINNSLINYEFTEELLYDCISILKFWHPYKKVPMELALTEYEVNEVETEISSMKLRVLPSIERCKDIILHMLLINRHRFRWFKLHGAIDSREHEGFPISINDGNILTIKRGSKTCGRWLRVAECLAFDQGEYACVYVNTQLGINEIKRLSLILSDICTVMIE